MSDIKDYETVEPYTGRKVPSRDVDTGSISMDISWRVERIPPEAVSKLRRHCRKCEGEFYSFFGEDTEPSRKHDLVADEVGVEATADIDMTDEQYQSAETVVDGMVAAVHILVLEQREKYADWKPAVDSEEFQQ